MRPSAVISRLRDACPLFGRRVAGAIGRTDAIELVMTEAKGLTTPCAYVLWEGEAVGSEQELDSLSDTVETTFSILVIVSGADDTTGQDACERLLDCRDEITAALVGWSPEPGRYGRMIYEGAPEQPVYNRAYGACSFYLSAQHYTDAP